MIMGITKHAAKRITLISPKHHISIETDSTPNINFKTTLTINANGYENIIADITINQKQIKQSRINLPHLNSSFITTFHFCKHYPFILSTMKHIIFLNKMI